MKRRDFISAVAAASAGSAVAGDQDRSADARPQPAVKPLTVTLLGTGTPAPSVDRQSSGYLIDVGTDLIVWDHGPGAHHRLIESGRRTVDVTHAFFTISITTTVWTTRASCSSGGIRGRERFPS